MRMYAVFLNNKEFVGFCSKEPVVPVKNYFLYQIEKPILRSELHSAYLADDGVVTYLDGKKVLEKLKGRNIIARIYYAITKYKRFAV